MDDECIFCRIIGGDIHADEVLRHDDVIAFRDVSPVAPVHVLVVPVRHIESPSSLSDDSLGGRMLACAAEVAEREGIAKSGYRIVVNTGANAGQSVNHLHLHVIGGRHMSWPPG